MRLPGVDPEPEMFSLLLKDITGTIGEIWVKSVD